MTVTTSIRSLRYLPGRLRDIPLGVWLVTLMMTGTAIYQYPTYGIARPAQAQETPDFTREGIPMVKEPLPLPPYALGTGLLILGTLLGFRWAFVLNIATVWIFPVETVLGIKGALHGSTLSVLHLVAVALLAMNWNYYWRKALPAA